MEDMDQVGEHHVGLHRHVLIEGFLPHIAVDDAFVLEGIEIGITGVFGLEGFIGKSTRIAVDDAPVSGVGRLAVNGFEIEVQAAGILVGRQEIFPAGITENLRQETAAAAHVPVAAVQLAAEHDGPFGHAWPSGVISL